MEYIHESLRNLAVEITSLIPDPANARKHNTRNLTVISNSLRLYGQRKPIVVQVTPDGKRVIRAGNGTVEAAKLLKWSHVAAVLVHEDNLSATGFALVDNKSAELAEWDKEVLEQHLFDLKMSDVNIEDLGFDVKVETTEEDVPEPPKEYLIVITCKTEAEQADLYQEFSDRDIACKIM